MRGTIKARAKFRRVYDEGERAIGRHLVVFAHRQDAAAETPTEVGVVASRKVGGAVQRSRAKRVLRHAWQTYRERVGRGKLVVLVARRSLIEDQMLTPAIEREMGALLQQLDLLEDARP